MEQKNESTVVNPPVSAPEHVPNTVDSTSTSPGATVPTATPADATALVTVPEATHTPEQATTNAAPRSLPVDDPMAIIPVDAAQGPPPQYDDHKRDAITTPEPVLALPQSDPRAIPTGPQVPVAQRVIPLAQLGEDPRRIHCPFCSHEVLTRISKESTSETTMAAVCCCLFGGIICAFLPYCMEMCHDTHHFCTNCGAKVAVRTNDGPVQVFSPNSVGPVVTAPGRIQPPEAVMKN